MILRIRKRWQFGLVFIVGILAFLWLSLNAPVTGCYAQAAELQPLDYCYRFTVSVSNNTGSPITDVIVPFTINSSSYIQSSYMGKYAWDLKTTPISLNPEIPMFAQDLSSASSRWWMQAYGTIADGATAQYVVSTGNASAKRDQGLQFEGSDSVTVATHADYALTNNITLLVRACSESCANPSATGQNAHLLDKYDTGTSHGYALQTISSAGALKVRGIVDGHTLDVSWDGTQKDIKMTFVAPTLTIYFDGVSQGSSNTGLAGATTNTTAITMGSTFLGNISYAAIWNNNVPISVWGFEPVNITEVSAAAPVYTGTISDELSAHNATYSFNRNTSNITVVVGPSQPINAPPVIDVIGIFGNQLGAQNLSGIYNAPKSTYTGPIPGLSTVSDAIAATGAPQQAGWLLFWSFIGVLFVIVPVILFPNLVAVAAAFGMALAFGASAQTISWFWVIAYIISVFVLWSAWEYQKQL